MQFPITLHFVTVHDLELFRERVVPRLRGHIVDSPPDEMAGAQGYHRLTIAVSSPSAAQDVCRQAFGFLAHLKKARIVFAWPTPGGETQYGEIVSGEARDADLLSTRLGAAAKAYLDAAKRPDATESQPAVQTQE